MGHPQVEVLAIVPADVLEEDALRIARIGALTIEVRDNGRVSPAVRHRERGAVVRVAAAGGELLLEEHHPRARVAVALGLVAPRVPVHLAPLVRPGGVDVIHSRVQRRLALEGPVLEAALRLVLLVPIVFRVAWPSTEPLSVVESAVVVLIQDFIRILAGTQEGVIAVPDERVLVAVDEAMEADLVFAEAVLHALRLLLELLRVGHREVVRGAIVAHVAAELVAERLHRTVVAGRHARGQLVFAEGDRVGEVLARVGKGHQVLANVVGIVAAGFLNLCKEDFLAEVLLIEVAVETVVDRQHARRGIV